MTDEELIEKIIAEHIALRCDARCDQDDAADKRHCTCRVDARAALTALREAGYEITKSPA